MAGDGRQLKLDEVSAKSASGGHSGNMVSDIFYQSACVWICQSVHLPGLSFCHLPVCLYLCPFRCPCVSLSGCDSADTDIALI